MSKKPRKYVIKDPDQCKSCNKASNCLFLQQLHQKPFDETGIILNCKAFYSVFRMLRDRDNAYSSDDSEEDRPVLKKGNDEICLDLTPAMITRHMRLIEKDLKRAEADPIIVTKDGKEWTEGIGNILIPTFLKTESIQSYAECFDVKEQKEFGLIK